MKYLVFAALLLCGTALHAATQMEIDGQTVTVLDTTDMTDEIAAARDLWQEEAYQEAYAVLDPAAEAGDPFAQNILGVALTDHKERFGKPYDPAAGFAYFERAVAQNLPRATFNLGLTFAETHEGFAPDTERAATLFRRAIAMGYVAAQNDLGLLHLGNRIEGADLAEAFRLFSLGSTRGEPAATYNLGTMYYDGAHVEKDDAAAFDLFTRASEQGNVKATHVLGYMFWQGLHVPTNLPAAYALMQDAAATGDIPAQIDLFYLISDVAYSDLHFHDPARAYGLCLSALQDDTAINFDEGLEQACNDAGSMLDPDVRAQIDAEVR